MKKLLIVLFIALLFGACQDRAVFFKDATLHYQDTRKCSCCGGFFMTIEEESDTFLIDVDSFNIAFMQFTDISSIPTDSIQEFLQDKATLPFDVRVKYKIDSDCASENRITEYTLDVRN